MISFYQLYMKGIVILYLCVCLSVNNSVLAQSNPKKIDVDWATNTSRHVVLFKDFRVQLAPDGIPHIDKPAYWNREMAKQFLLLMNLR